MSAVEGSTLGGVRDDLMFGVRALPDEMLAGEYEEQRELRALGHSAHHEWYFGALAREVERRGLAEQVA